MYFLSIVGETITAQASIRCPACTLFIEEDDPSVVGCDEDVEHWWHRWCLPLHHLTVVDDSLASGESWACPLCQNRLERTCTCCLMVEFTSSDSDDWFTCGLCHSHIHIHCMPEQHMLYAISSTQWVCMKCQESL